MTAAFQTSAFQGGGPPVTAGTTTAQGIRDQMITVVEAIVPLAAPASAPGNRFKRYLNEGDGDFIEWAESNPTAAFRRFQVRAEPDQLSDVSNTDVEARVATFRILVAYPQTARTGKANALGRDDAMSTDQRQIENATGVTGYGNFPSASWVSGAARSRIIGKVCDFLVIEQTMRFYRSFP